MPRKRLTTQEKAKRMAERYDKQNAYAKDHYKTYTIKLNKESHADVIQKLESVPNKADYIVRLIRADIVANGIE